MVFDGCGRVIWSEGRVSLNRGITGRHVARGGDPA